MNRLPPMIGIYACPDCKHCHSEGDPEYEAHMTPETEIEYLPDDVIADLRDAKQWVYTRQMLRKEQKK